MREGWTYKKLGEVAISVKDGDWIESKDQSDNGIRLIQTGNVGDGLFKPKEDKPHFISEETMSRLGCTEIFEGDCLVSRLPDPVGRACIIPNIGCRMITAVDCSIIRFGDNYLSKFFVDYTLSSGYRNSINNNTTGTTRKRISRKNLEKIPIPVPPRAEQERIVAELDLLSSVIEKKKAQLQEYDQLAQSIFYDMFGTTNIEKGWDIKKLGEVGVFQRGGGFLKSDFVDNGFPCIHYGQIHTRFGAFTYTHLTSITEELAKSKSKIAKRGDVIIAITSEDVEGSCKCVAWLGDYDVAVGAHAAIFKHNLNPIYVSYYFKSEEYNIAKTRYARGFKVVEIKPDDIAKIDIPLPPLSLQQLFAEKIEAIEQQKALVQASIAETETLFNSRMDYYFG